MFKRDKIRIKHLRDAAKANIDAEYAREKRLHDMLRWINIIQYRLSDMHDLFFPLDPPKIFYTNHPYEQRVNNELGIYRYYSYNPLTLHDLKFSPLDDYMSQVTRGIISEIQLLQVEIDQNPDKISWTVRARVGSDFLYNYGYDINFVRRHGFDIFDMSETIAHAFKKLHINDYRPRC